MDKKINNKRYDLCGRTMEFSKQVIQIINKLPKNLINIKIFDQVIRSAGSIGANYREANESETKKEFLYRIRICRKESKETDYWLELLIENNVNEKEKISILQREAIELMKIFAQISINSS